MRSLALRRVAGSIRDAIWSAVPSSDALYRRNARNVMIDGMGVGLVTGVATFLSVFLIRLGASNLQVGLLTSMPAVTGAILALPIGKFIQERRNIILWYARARLWVLSSYALTGIVPWLAGDNTTIAIIAIWALATLPQTMVNVTFTLVMGAVAGPERRLHLMSRRWATLGITNAVSVAIVGWTLDRMAFPINYQVVFIGSFVGGLISYYFSTSIVLPSGAHEPSSDPTPWYAAFRGMRRLLADQPAFTRFAVSQFVYRLGMSMTLPLQPLYWVRIAQANDASIGLINTVNSGVLLVAYTIWSVVAQRHGARRVLLVCGLGLALYPFLVSFNREIWQLVLLAGMAGTFVAGADLVLFDVLVDTLKPEYRGASVGLYHMTTYVATFAGPMLATTGSDYFGIVPMLLVAAGLRLGGTILFWLLDVARVEAAPAD